MASFVHQPSVLLVEPDPAFRSRLAVAAGHAAVESHATFETARPRLETLRCDLLVSNIRLGAFNGLHLVYIARLTNARGHAVVYDDVHSTAMAREAHVAGAFYELRDRVPITLPAYLAALARLPAADRRNPDLQDRRSLPRGGRRRWDRHIMTPPPATA